MDESAALAVQLQEPSGGWVEVGMLYHARAKNWFEFTDSYWRLANRPILGQVFEEHGRFWRPNAHVALPRWFSHLLPEGQLRAAVANAAEISEKREFEMIRTLGATDLPGAVRVVEMPAGLRRQVPIPEVEREADERDPLLKFSLAGVQMKFSVYGSERGLTVPARGSAGNCILKLPDPRPGFAGVPEAELAALELARAVGVPTPRAWLVNVGEVVGLEGWANSVSGQALAIERFDRRDGDNRIHMEELAQVLDVPTREGAKYRYANLEMVGVFVGAHSGTGSVGEVIDRIVLNVLIGNGDAHLKNWAFTYPDGQHPRLSPVYDIVPTVLYLPADDLGLNLNKSKAFTAVSAESFDVLAARTDFGVAESRARVKAAVERVLDRWELLADFLPGAQYRTLTDRLGSLALVAAKSG